MVPVPSIQIECYERLKDYQFDTISNLMKNVEYKIAVNDQLNFQLYTNNGFQLIDRFNESGSWSKSIDEWRYEWKFWYKLYGQTR